MYALHDALRMGPAARDELFELVTGSAPALKALTVDPTVDYITARWADAHVHAQPNPTVLMDGGWNARHFNAAWERIFDAIEPHPTDHPLDNPMRFLLFHELASSMFPDEERWLVTAMTQVAVHLALRPENPTLLDLRRRIHAVPRLEELYVGRVRQGLTERGVDMVLEGDVSQRPVLFGSETCEILLTVLIPWHARDYGYQMMTMSPRDGRLLTAPPSVLPIPQPQADPRPRGEGEPVARTRCYAEGALTVGQLLHWYRTRHVGITQEHLARAHLPVTDRTYRTWETDKDLPRVAYVPHIATALQMPDSVRRYLYSLITKGDAPMSGTWGGPTLAARSDLWIREHVDDRNQPAPTALLDGTWNILACNNAYHRLFAHVPAHPRNSPTQNWLRYVLFHPDARESLGQWQERWLIGAMSDLVTTLVRQQKELSLEHLEILQDIEADPTLSNAYTCRIRRQMREAMAAPLCDGDIRTMRIPSRSDPGGARTDITICITAGVPLHGKAYGYKLLTLAPQDEQATPSHPSAAESE
ncbi:hypothetical protein [Streptomyces sioyaensis]|uniref:MmyB family transcriptional regulator n=1 Tax=Streptomyces sioyaensis TaxID=67364 RepID=UPI003789E2B1